MPRLQLVLSLALMMNPANSGAALSRNAAPVSGRSIRIIHASVGCGSLASLWRIATMTVRDGADAALAQMPAENCRLFSFYQGQLIEKKDGAVCILGGGGAHCLWFVASATRPSKQP